MRSDIVDRVNWGSRGGQQANNVNMSCIYLPSVFLYIRQLIRAKRAERLLNWIRRCKKMKKLIFLVLVNNSEK